MSVSHDVRDGFAKRESQNALLNGIELQRLALTVQHDACRSQRRSRALQLFFEGFGAIPENGLLDVGQRLTENVLDVEISARARSVSLIF